MHTQSVLWKRIVCAASINTRRKKVARQKAARLKHAPWKAALIVSLSARETSVNSHFS